MSTTQSAYDWLRTKATRAGAARPAAHRAHARAEIERLANEIQALVTAPRNDSARAAIDAALDTVVQLQIATANLDACNPPQDSDLARTLVAYADARLHGHADAIERGMTYTADNTLRLLRPE